jgi:hypothetical protein
MTALASSSRNALREELAGKLDEMKKRKKP